MINENSKINNLFSLLCKKKIIENEERNNKINKYLHFNNYRIQLCYIFIIYNITEI